MRQENGFETRVLIADADELSLALTKTTLETRQFLAFAAFTCDQALAIAASQVLNLVVCDCDMRTNTGVHLETLVHSVPINRDVPFLFTSSHQKPDIISRRKNDRNVFFIRKPFDHEALLELVDFAMWMPHLIRSHIEQMHVRQGLKQPHSKSNHVAIMSDAPAPAFGIMPIHAT